MPDAVKIVPRGVSSFPGYVYDGNQLVAIDRRPGGDAIREKINASYREAARKRRLTKAATGTQVVQAAQAPRKPASRKHIERIKAAAEKRADEVRALAEAGATTTVIAKHMGITENSARKYCQRMKIKATPKVQRHIIAAQEKRERARALAAEGLAAFEIADRIGVPRRRISEFLRDGGVAGVSRKAEIEADLAARRAKVAELFKAGLSATRIAAEIGTTHTIVYTDCQMLGLNRKDYPLLKRAKPRKSGQDRAAMLASIAKRQKEAVRLRGDGWTIKAIADHLDCGAATVMDYLSKAGMTKHYSGVVGDPAMFARADAMRARKMTFREIAYHLGVTKSTVQRLLQTGRAA
jgi:DNA-binding NarL/FixJ family response regulator